MGPAFATNKERAVARAADGQQARGRGGEKKRGPGALVPVGPETAKADGGGGLGIGRDPAGGLAWKQQSFIFDDAGVKAAPLSVALIALEATSPRGGTSLVSQLEGTSSDRPPASTRVAPARLVASPPWLPRRKPARPNKATSGMPKASASARRRQLPSRRHRLPGCGVRAVRPGGGRAT